MAVSFLEYRLNNGYVDNWLVAGPRAVAVGDLERYGGDNWKLRVARNYAEPGTGLEADPVERDTFALGGEQLVWRYVRCLDDHLVDLSAFYHTCHYLRAWAYAELDYAETRAVSMVVTTNGPADIWLNGRHIHRHEHFHHQIPHSVAVEAPVTLRRGRNRILVRFEEVAMRECPYAMALRIVDHRGNALPVLLPSRVEPLARRALLERVFDSAYLDRDVFLRNDEVLVRWPPTLDESATVMVRIQDPRGRIYGEAYPAATASASASITKGYQLLEGAYRILLMPRAEEYYLQNVRIRREIPLWVSKNAYSEAAYGSYGERRLEALHDAAQRDGHVFGEIAKVELGRWSEVVTAVIEQSVDNINRRADCSDFYLTGLLGMLHRSIDDPAFPAELKDSLEACVLNFRYWIDEPGSDAMCFWSENHQILFHTCEILAGQLYGERVFSNAGQTGSWHREKGERMALAWLRKRAGGGFREWDSNCYFEEDVLALAHLADLAEDDQVREFAAVVLDKLFFSLAINSFNGVFGSTHGRSYTPLLKGGRLESTAGISRLLWGMGVFNHHVLGTVSLACAQNYELPPIIAAIAVDRPGELWSRERHAGELEQWCDQAIGSWEVDKVTYKTPDYMLCSAQDYHPGETGYQQHIWQATFGPDAVAFVTHPGCVSEEGSHRPNFWHGNVVLPRVAQWKDVLIAVHKLPDDDWLGFTHAYLPQYAFDEYVLRDGWAFARKGDGYLALTAAQGLTPITTGDNAYRELRSYGAHNIWLCQLGRAALDGSFEDFQQAILELRPHFDGLSLRTGTLRGEILEFGWQGALLVNGRETAIGGFSHFENMYCTAELNASQMELRLGDEMLRLNFS